MCPTENQPRHWGPWRSFTRRLTRPLNFMKIFYQKTKQTIELQEDSLPEDESKTLNPRKIFYQKILQDIEHQKDLLPENQPGHWTNEDFFLSLSESRSWKELRTLKSLHKRYGSDSCFNSKSIFWFYCIPTFVGLFYAEVNLIIMISSYTWLPCIPLTFYPKEPLSSLFFIISGNISSQKILHSVLLNLDTMVKFL